MEAISSNDMSKKTTLSANQYRNHRSAVACFAIAIKASITAQVASMIDENQVGTLASPFRSKSTMKPKDWLDVRSRPNHKKCPTKLAMTRAQMISASI